MVHQSLTCPTRKHYRFNIAYLERAVRRTAGEKKAGVRVACQTEATRFTSIWIAFWRKSSLERRGLLSSTFSRNSPGIQRAARAAGNASRSGACVLCDVTTPRVWRTGLVTWCASDKIHLSVSRPVRREIDHRKNKNGDRAGGRACPTNFAMGADRCGLTSLAERSVATPYFGVVAASLVIAGFVRLANGGTLMT